MTDVQIELLDQPESSNGHVAATRPADLRREARAKPIVRIETVTPTTAERWLSGNLHNRSLRDQRVVNLAAVLQRGEWRLTGDAICFDATGVLLNGQHRLTAIVVAGVPAELLVLRGLPGEAQEVMDQNLKRSVGDALKLRGERNAVGLATGLAWIHRVNYIMATGKPFYSHVGEGLRPTTPQLLAVLDADHDRIVEKVKAVNTIRLAVPIRQGVHTALWLRFEDINAEEAAQFYTSLMTGAMLPADSPILTLRRSLINHDKAIDSLPDYREAVYTIIVWNHWREDEPLNRLSWRWTPTKRDSFPRPK